MSDCICCGSERRETVAGNRIFPAIDVVRCVTCGLVYPFPRPPEEEVARYYRDSYYSFGGLAGGLFRQLKLYFSGMRAEHQFRWIVSRLELGSQGRVLELGSGYGRLLQRFHRKGWEVSGIEPSRDCAEYTKGLFGGRQDAIFNGTFEAYDPGERRFDLILLSHVFEHFTAPETVIDKLSDMLVPGGHMFFELPNGECPHYRETRYLLVPDFYFFDSGNFPRFISAHSLETVHLGHVANRWLIENYSRAGFAINYIWWALLGLFGVSCFRESGREAITLRALVRKPAL